MRHISYKSYYESPIGLIEISCNFETIYTVKFKNYDEEYYDNKLSNNVKKKIGYYFEGKKRYFKEYQYFLPSISKRIFNIVMEIPYGKTMSIKSLAKKVGNEEAIDTIINILKENPCPILIPCHRVIPTADMDDFYVDSIDKKKYLQEFEKSYLKGGSNYNDHKSKIKL